VGNSHVKGREVKCFNGYGV